MLGYVIGDGDMVTGLRLVGVEGAEAASVEEAKDALEKALTRKDLALIIISEEFSLQPALRELIGSVRLERISPLILEVPSSSEKRSSVRMSDLIGKTLGVRA